MSRVLTVAFHIDDPTGGALAMDLLERVSPGIRPFAYAWGDTMKERTRYREALERFVNCTDEPGLCKCVLLGREALNLK